MSYIAFCNASRLVYIGEMQSSAWLYSTFVRKRRRRRRKHIYTIYVLSLNVSSDLLLLFIWLRIAVFDMCYSISFLLHIPKSCVCVTISIFIRTRAFLFHFISFQLHSFCCYIPCCCSHGCCFGFGFACVRLSSSFSHLLFFIDSHTLLYYDLSCIFLIFFGFIVFF